MRNAFIGIGFLTVAIGVGIVASKSAADDQVVVDTVVSSMNADDLAPHVIDRHSNPPDLTPEVIVAVIEDLKDIEAHNGLTAIAFSHHISEAQVKMILASIQKRRAELNPVDVGDVGHP
mgnify:CR=1 FL=1